LHSSHPPTTPSLVFVHHFFSAFNPSQSILTRRPHNSLGSIPVASLF
jgi:hypothetical protein